MTANEDNSWVGDCNENPEMWDYHSEDGETWKEQRVRHLIVARICTTCPEIIPCTEKLLAQTQPVTGVWAGQIFSGQGDAGPARRGRKTA